MSRSRTLFQIIERNLSGVALCKDMLVVFPTSHILRGFLLETTTVKDHLYLWRVIAPLYRPMDRVFLDYSTRIPKGERIYLQRGAFKASAETIRAIIEGHIGYLESVYTPRDFLRHIGWMIGNSEIRFRFDFALTQYRVGDIRKAQELFQGLDNDVDRMEEGRRLPVDNSIKQAAKLIATHPEQLGPLLDKWESENIENLGLRATLDRVIENI
jgi:hypothetical protein